MFWTAFRAEASGSDRGPEADFWYQALPGTSGIGLAASPDQALALPAVYAAVRVITEAIMQLPLFLYRRLADNGKERAVEHPLYGLLRLEPNELQTAAEWREMLQHHLLMRGNAYSKIEYAGQEIRELRPPWHPDTVKPEWVKAAGSGTMTPVYTVQEDGEINRYSADEVLHLRGLGIGSDGLTGMNPIELERHAISTGLQAQSFTERFLANDARPGGWIEHPNNFKTDEQKSKFRGSWDTTFGGMNRGRTAVLEYGMKYHAVDLKLVDAQFLETRKYTNLDVARIFRVPPHLIMELDRATFSNITQQDIEFVKFTMLPWLVRWEQRLIKQLLMPDEMGEYFFEFLVEGLERGDGEARSNYYKAGIQDGWLTRNEVRVKENMNPIEGLDEPLEPMNMRNPGGANDERLNALKLSAAKACARAQRNDIESIAEPTDFLRADAPRVQRLMQCSAGKAMNVCQISADLVEQDIANGIEYDAWEARQVQLLVDLT